MSLGPVILDLAGPRLDAADRELLGHPAVGGVILFSRNYEEPALLRELVDSIHAIREPRLIVTVDHEGGRVQRFRHAFTALPPAAAYGKLYDENPERGIAVAREGGWVMAAELRAAGIDLSYAPVMDLRSGRSAVIGDRALHRDPEVVARLGRAFAAGMHDAGMASVVKHFPGHGHVTEDSHVASPVDERDLESLRLADLLSFERAVHAGAPAVMTGHVVYPAVDDAPAGFSRRWIEQILRRDLGFRGAVISDDLGMAGAGVAGDLCDRATLALDAGCDVVLVCNCPESIGTVLEAVPHAGNPVRAARLVRLHGRGHALDAGSLAADPRRAAAVAMLARLVDTPELDLSADESV